MTHIETKSRTKSGIPMPSPTARALGALEALTVFGGSTGQGLEEDVGSDVAFDFWSTRRMIFHALLSVKLTEQSPYPHWYTLPPPPLQGSMSSCAAMRSEASSVMGNNRDNYSGTNDWYNPWDSPLRSMSCRCMILDMQLRCRGTCRWKCSRCLRKPDNTRKHLL